MFGQLISAGNSQKREMKSHFLQSSIISTYSIATFIKQLCNYIIITLFIIINSSVEAGWPFTSSVAA